MIASLLLRHNLSRAYLERAVWRFRLAIKRGSLRLIQRFGASK